MATQRITRKMVDAKVHALNAVLAVRNAVCTYSVHSEYGYLVLESRNKETGNVEEVLRGLDSRNMYMAIKCAWAVLIDNIPMKNGVQK